MSVNELLKKYADKVSDYIVGQIENMPDAPDILKQAMIYSVSAGGKRIRPSLALEFYRALGKNPDEIINFAAAIEMIHTYSLIHDDLPCMDNDDMRRGKPSCHKAFGEGIALLAGDALLTQAFYAAADVNEAIAPKNAVKAIKHLSFAAGMSRMVGGQVIDLQSEGKKIEIEELERLQYGKTVAMLRVSAEIACCLCDADDKHTSAAVEYCENIGKAFQIRDDILDVIGNEKTFGKPVGSDKENEKNTYVSIYGLERAQELCDELTDKAIAAAGVFGDCENLSELAKLLCNREK